MKSRKMKIGSARLGTCRRVLLTTAEASDYLRTPIRTLENWRKDYWRKRHGWTGPIYVKIGRHVFYELRDLRQFLRGARRESK